MIRKHLKKPFIVRGPEKGPSARRGSRKPQISVLIINYNGRRHIQRCLDSLARQSFGDFEAILIDNASQDESLDAISLPDSRFRLVCLNRNLGFAGGNNLAASLSSGRWLATLNPDAFPEPDWLQKLIEACAQHPEAAMFGSTQVMDREPWLLDGCGDVFSGLGIAWRGGYRRQIGILPGKGETFSPCAAAALYRTDVFEQLGGFDEDFFCYFEDVDLGFRFRLAGHKCIQVPEAIVRHSSGGINSRTSPLTTYFGQRNSLWAHIKNMPAPLCLITLPCHILLQFLLLMLTAFRIFRADRTLRKKLAINLKARQRACIHGIFKSGPQWKKRNAIQKNRLVSTMGIARSFCWSLTKFIRRDPDVRPLMQA